jgi:hypothetical protein
LRERFLLLHLRLPLRLGLGLVLALNQCGLRAQ